MVIKYRQNIPRSVKNLNPITWPKRENRTQIRVSNQDSSGNEKKWNKDQTGKNRQKRTYKATKEHEQLDSTENWDHGPGAQVE